MLGNTSNGAQILGSHELAVLVAHGFVGGLVSEAGGGRFFSGFLAGGVSSLGPTPTGAQTWDETAAGATEDAVLGGVGSILGGGKFQNGAITGAFGYLFNDYAHSWANEGVGIGAVAGGIGLSAACDAATAGVCALGTAGTFIVGSAAGAPIGYAMGEAAGTVADDLETVVVTAPHANAADSMQGTELYYLINRSSGKIDKIGVTSYPGQRYSDAYLQAQNVLYQTQYYFEWRYAAYVAENIELTQYYVANGQLPRLNQVTR